jgi:hypothetical protein
MNIKNCTYLLYYTMSGHYDELTTTTYYDPQMVMNITEYDSDGDKDSNVFILYDEEQEAYYVFGSRGGSKHVRYTKAFYCMNDLYNFISITMGFKDNHTVSLSINYMSNLTNYDEYDDIKQKVSRFNEVVAYDNFIISRQDFKMFLKSFF